MLSVGWLDKRYPFPKGEIDPALIEKLRRLVAKSTWITRGLHICEFCEIPAALAEVHQQGRTGDPAYWEWLKPRSSNGEIRVSLHSVTYAAPFLVPHYIEVHKYLPPQPFLVAVEQAPE